MRDFRTELAGDRCWDQHTENLWKTTGVPRDDTILQNREELIGLCEFIQQHQIRSYLEIGAWTGRLVSVLHRLFHFDKVACCDYGMAPQLGLPFQVPADVQLFKGSSHSEEYKRWREGLGHIDLVMIDGDHSYAGVRLDYQINRAYPHRFLGFHDIVNPNPEIAVGRVWKQLQGHKVEIVHPHREIGWDRSQMGIGIWSEQA